MTAAFADVVGAVHRPHDAGFAAAHRGFNLAEAHQPDLVVTAAGTADVSAAVRYGAEHNLPVRVQATGHGIGTAMTGGLLVNTAELRGLHIDPAQRTATAEAGVRWAEVIEAAAQSGLAPLAGSSPTVGVVGYTLGGGMGPMARTFGFASDRVREFTMVDAEGSLLTVDAEHEPELFWALRGGKPEVGIVTSVQFDLVEVPHYYGGSIVYPGEQAEQVLTAWAQWSVNVPETVSTSIALLRLPDEPAVPEPLRGRLSVHLRYVYIGADEAGAELLAPIRAAGTPLVDLVRRCTPDEIATVHQDPTEAMPARDDALLLRAMPDEAVHALLGAAGPNVDVPLIVVEVRRMGGALARPGEHDSAVAGRDAAFNLGVIGPYPPPLQEAVDAACIRVLDALRPRSTGGRLINFEGYARDPQQVRAVWPESTLARLTRLHTDRDPDARFRFGYPWRELSAARTGRPQPPPAGTP